MRRHGPASAPALWLRPFGDRKHQLRAAVDVVFGELAATGILPAKIR